MKEFFAVARYRMAVPATVNPAGGVIMPSAVLSHDLAKRRFKKDSKHLSRRLLDPQLYLIGINPNTARRPCSNLSTYDWFPVKKRPKYDSKKHPKRKDSRKDFSEDLEKRIHDIWIGSLPSEPDQVDEAVRVCLDYQKRLGVEAYVLPAPLTNDYNSSLDTELDWLERGLAKARAVNDRPVFASVAVSDTAIRNHDPWTNPLVEQIVDQLTARDVENVYIVLEQANENGYYFTHPNTIGALLRLCNAFDKAGIERILVNYAGTAGLMALVAGADAWATGYGLSERRLRVSDLEAAEGRQYPAYYSHPLASELHLESDLDKVSERGFLSRIADETPRSKGLLKALAEGKASKDVAEWENSINNVTAAREHFLLVCARETKKLAGLSEGRARDSIRKWLEDATRLATDIRDKKFNTRTALGHQAGWLAAFEAFEKNREKS